MNPERLTQLEENISRLADFKKTNNRQNVVADTMLGWALRYGLFETIQITIDIACHIAAKHNFGSTSSYRDCINSLEQFDVLDSHLSDRLRAMVGLRNILIHEYVKIDVDQLYDYLDYLDDFRAFVLKTSEFIAKP